MIIRISRKELSVRLKLEACDEVAITYINNEMHVKRSKRDQKSHTYKERTLLFIS